MAQYRFTNNGVAPRIVFNERQMPVTIPPGGYAVVALDDATVRQMTRICASDPTLQVAIDQGEGEPKSEPSPQPQPSPPPAPPPAPAAPEPVDAPPAAPEPAPEPEPAPAPEPEPAKPPAHHAPAQPARKKSRRRA